MAGVNAGSAGTKSKGRKVLFVLNSSIWHGDSEGFSVSLHSYREHLSSPRAGKAARVAHPNSPQATGFVHRLSRELSYQTRSEVVLVFWTGWGCLARTESCWPDSELLKISIFIQSHSCCMCLFAVSLQCGKASIFLCCFCCFCFFVFWCYLKFLSFSIVSGWTGICFACLNHISVKID